MTIKHISLIILVAAFTSCQKSDNDLMHEAQSCLNTAPENEARNCVSKISALTTPAAYKLKCAAIYRYEGFGAASSLITALDGLNDGDCASCSGGTGSSTLTVMSAFNFSRGDNTDADNRTRNLATADEAVATCAQSQSKAYIQVASLFKLGTLSTMMAHQLGAVAGAAPTAAELEAALPSLTPADVGSIVELTFNATCVGNQDPSDSTIEYCNELEAAIGSNQGDFTAIGSCLLGKLNDPNFVCP